MKRILAFLFAFVALVSVASADFNDTPYTDLLARPFKEHVIVNTIIVDGASDMTTGHTVASFDLATSPTYTIPAADFTNPWVGLRTVAVELTENSGTALNGVIQIIGTNQYGQRITENLTFAAGKRFCLSQNAFLTITSIGVAMKATAASDVLNITPGGFGFLARTTNPVAVNVLDGITTYTVAASYVWDDSYSVLTGLGTAVSEGDTIEIIGYQDVYTRPSGGTYTTAAP